MTQQVDGEQAFDEMAQTTMFKFVGVKYESLSTGFDLDQEVEFRLRGKVVEAGGTGKRKDGTVFHPIKIEVGSVVPVSFEEPDDDSVKVLDEDAEDDNLFSDGGE